MKRIMTRKEGRAYLKRWRGVARFLNGERKKVSFQQKFHQILVLFAAGKLFARPKKNPKEKTRQHTHWSRLHHLLNHG